MNDNRLYTLPSLPYEYTALSPQISETQLRVHHQKHHQAYVTGANTQFAILDKARTEHADIDLKNVASELSFFISGFRLHNLFFENLAPAGKGGGGVPEGELAGVLNSEFGTIDRFRKEFTQAAVSTGGSGWAALTYSRMTGRPLIMQIEKHNVKGVPGLVILMAFDVWEHAYYLDYRNDRARYAAAFWDIVNWDVIGQRFNKSKEIINHSRIGI